jgi:hypothetical protein
VFAKEEEEEIYVPLLEEKLSPDEVRQLFHEIEHAGHHTHAGHHSHT